MSFAWDEYFSFSGILSFKKAKNLVEVASEVPIDRMHIETDAPFLAPVPMRGKENEPAFVKYVGEFLAKVKEVSTEEFQKKMWENTHNIFDLN